jgi:hypothetical protein
MFGGNRCAPTTHIILSKNADARRFAPVGTLARLYDDVFQMERGRRTEAKGGRKKSEFRIQTSGFCFC